MIGFSRYEMLCIAMSKRCLRDDCNFENVANATLQNNKLKGFFHNAPKVQFTRFISIHTIARLQFMPLGNSLLFYILPFPYSYILYMNKTIKSFSIVTFFSIATRLISFIFKMWMSRALGAEVVGQYQIALSVLLMLLTITAGAPTVLSRKVAEVGNVNIKKQNSYLTASLILGLSISLLVVGILYACQGHIGFLFSNKACLPIFLVMLPTLITSTVYASLRGWFWGRKNFVAFSSTELVDEIVKIILAVVFASGVIVTMDGAMGIALAMTLSDTICVIALLIIFFCSNGRFAKPSGFKDLTLRTIPLSATRIITSLSASLTALIIPNMLISNGMSIGDATAEYGRVAGMALPLIMAPITFIGALSVVLTPDVASLAKNGDTLALKSKLQSSMTFSLLIASVFFVIYLPLGKILGSTLFDDAHAGEFVSYSAIILFPIAISQATTPMLNSLGKERSTFVNNLVGTLMMLPCIFFLPKVIGVYAMAVASGLCFLIISILNTIALRRAVGKFWDVSKLVKTLAFSIPLACLGVFTTRLIHARVGDIGTMLVVGVLIMFFLIVFISAFDIVDVQGYVKLIVGGKSKKLGRVQKRRT